MKDQIHRAIVEKLSHVAEWFQGTREGLYVPFYSSYDIRDAGFKVVNVDANIFPAGFNNICQADKDHSVELAKDYIVDHYGAAISSVLLLAEEHTQNPFYWENIRAIKEIVESGGFKVVVAVPGETIKEPFVAKSVMGAEFLVEIAEADADGTIKGFRPDVVITNNDFTSSYESWVKSAPWPINPAPGLGWHQRKKSTYFKFYNQVATEFASIIGVPPEVFRVRTELFSDFDVQSEDSRAKLARSVEEMMAHLKDEYQRLQISHEPYIYIKNNAGTYGLGVTQVQSPKDVLEWNYKIRKKMKASKGGGGIQEVILQEGVPTELRSDQAVAEPSIYMVGCALAGGFLRTHQEKSDKESLNSPGAIYKRLCVSDLEIDVEGRPLENVYGWVARLGLLAIGLETQDMGVKYSGYQMKKC